ncbi:MAG: tetratricopeptide repeat protein [Elusimicrobia bacterium]|nr:tetratricopeptide repeat protein [Elusimicrobiota bacterium]
MIDRPSAARRRLSDRALGRAVFAAGWCVWLALEASLLPVDVMDLAYLLSLEHGRWVIQELVHPAFVPLLAGWRGLLGLFGYSGAMLLPVGALNLAASAGLLAGLFLWVESWTADSLAAALSVLLAGFMEGVAPGCLRPTPYALAACASAACLVLLSGLAPGGQAVAGAGSSLRYAASGAAGGLAASLHASAMSLVPVAAAAVFLDGRARPSRGRSLLAWAGAFLAVVLASCAALRARHGIGWEFLRSIDPVRAFFAVEQHPRTSIFTSGDLGKQVADYGWTLFWQGGPFLFLVAAMVPAAFFLRRRGPAGSSGSSTPAPALPLAVSFLNLLAFAAFFLINNTSNGFIFAGLLLLPLPLALAAAEPRLRRLFVPASLAALAWSALCLPRHTMARSNDPMLAEVRSLESLLGPRDVLLLPGSPYPEALYLRHFNILDIGDWDDGPPFPEVPRARPGPGLLERVDSYLRRGRKVFFSAGDVDFLPALTLHGAWKDRQVFMPAKLAPGDRKEEAAGLMRLFGSRFELAAAGRSPRGVVFYRLARRGVLRTGSEVGAGGLPGERRFSLDAGRWRVGYLRRWLALAPEDEYALRDLDEAVAESKVFFPADRGLVVEAASLAGLWAVRMGRPRLAASILERAARARPDDAELQGELASAAWSSGQRDAALRALSRAESLRPDERNRHRMAILHMELGRHRPALELLDGLVREHPVDGRYLSDRGIVKEYLGLRKEALRDLRSALERDPGCLPAALSLGGIYSSQGRPREALAVYDKALSRPSSAELRPLRERVLAERAKLKP